jgi:hypothetical protein
MEELELWWVARNGVSGRGNSMCKGPEATLIHSVISSKPCCTQEETLYLVDEETRT